MKTMRQVFADTMLDVGKKDPNLIVLIGDISHFILQPFARECRNRFYNVGICENTIVGMAAGLAKVGFSPVVHTISPFIVERSFEQIKLDFGYQKLGVNIVTVGSAFDYVALGCTHHCYGDFALLKTVSGMQIVYPASPGEFNLLFRQTYNNGYPTYFRLPEHQHGVNFSKKQIRFGRGIIVRNGKDITIIALGPQLKTAISAASEIIKLGMDPEIIYLHTIKPLDVKMITKSLKKTKKCLVLEEHGLYGGVFDDVLRVGRDLSGVKYAVINTGDKFIHNYGTYGEYCEYLGFSVKGIIAKIKKELF